jgi:CheY-like chemotaxis protein
MGVASPGIVLHIEDNPQVRKALAIVLSIDGYSVTGAVSGPEALELAAQGLRPDLLIVDFNLDEQMNGAEAAQAMRYTLGYCLPIIMLTADPSQAQFPWTIDSLIWLTRKPLNPQLLLGAIPSLVQLSRSLRGLLARASSTSPSSP